MNSLSVNRKNYAKIALFFILSFLVLGAIFSSVKTASAEITLDNLETTVTSVISKIQAPIVAIATAAGGLSMIICIAMILFTHDEKKIAGYIRICITIAIALLVIYLINLNAIVPFIKSIAESIAGGN